MKASFGRRGALWLLSAALATCVLVAGIGPTNVSDVKALVDVTSIAYVLPVSGATVSGSTPVRLEASADIDWIGVYACDGSSVGEDTVRDSDGGFSVQWDTSMLGCSNGSQPLDVYAFKLDGSQVGEAHETVNIQNDVAPPPPPPSSDCTASSEPGPIAGQGYTQVFGDCFDFLDRSVWCSHQWWEPNPPAGTQFADSSGVLHLQRRRVDGYPNNTLSSEPCGQTNPKSFQGGYMEARLKFTGVPGSGPAFWLFSTRHATNPAWPNVNPYCADHGLPIAQCYSAELDVFEGYGNHPDVFTGTVHRNSCNCYGVNDDQNSNNWQPQAAGTNLSSDWHVYAVKWAGSQVAWYLDGVLQMTAPVYASTPQPMHPLFYNWDTPWESGNGTSASSPDIIETQVDWVRVWQP
jgi:Glycosyl hydrolases family 16